MPETSPLIITGMHRSGTSLLAKLMREAGVDVGDRLVEASPFNPRGYFEDRSFVELHDAILADNGTHWADSARVFGELTIRDERRRRALELVAGRGGAAAWGWKDPRTVLLLDFWESLLPGARFVFIFRSPALVVDSLRRRRDAALRGYDGPGASLLHRVGLTPFRCRRALELWVGYNRALLAFAGRHRERCLLLDVDRLVEQFPRAVGHIRQRWEVPLRDVDVESVLERQLMKPKAIWWVERACRGVEVDEVLGRLRSEPRP